MVSDGTRVNIKEKKEGERGKRRSEGRREEEENEVCEEWNVVSVITMDSFEERLETFIDRGDRS